MVKPLRRIHDDLRQLAVDVAVLEKCLLESGRRIGPRAQDGAPRRALRNGQQVRRQIRLPSRQQPLLAGLAGAEAVAPIVFRNARQSSAGRVPVGADAFKREAMPLGRLPIDAAKSDPLRGGARRRAEQPGQLLQTRAAQALRAARRGNRYRPALSSRRAQLRAQQLDLRRLGGQKNPAAVSDTDYVPMGCLTVASPGSLR